MAKLSGDEMTNIFCNQVSIPHGGDCLKHFSNPLIKPSSSFLLTQLFKMTVFQIIYLARKRVHGPKCVLSVKYPDLTIGSNLLNSAKTDACTVVKTLK